MKARALTEAQLESIHTLVRERTGLAFAPSRRQQTEAGIRKAMEAAAIGDGAVFVRALSSDERSFELLIENLTVAETYFFRDREQFEVLRRQVLPELIRRLPDREPLRLWSAGCATGEEPYSLAILLEQEALERHSHIIATDISREAVARARRGTYGAWSLRDNPPELATGQYFQRRGDTFVLLERVRRRVEFAVFNLASDRYAPDITGPSGFDLILCRNVLIYFDAAAIERVARQLFGSLREGGWLITGPSDPPLWQHAPFETLLTPAGILYRRRADSRAARSQPAIGKPRCVAGHPMLLARQTPQVARPPMVATPVPKPAATACSGARTEPAPVRSATGLAALQALATQADAAGIVSAVEAAIAAEPLSPELHYFRAITQMSAGRYDQAAASLRRALYLDHSMAVAHFALASIHARRGSIAQARRCYRNVIALCGSRRAEEIVPFSEGEETRRLVEAARAQLASIARPERGQP